MHFPHSKFCKRWNICGSVCGILSNPKLGSLEYFSLKDFLIKSLRYPSLTLSPLSIAHICKIGQKQCSKKCLWTSADAFVTTVHPLACVSVRCRSPLNHATKHWADCVPAYQPNSYRFQITLLGLLLKHRNL